MRRGFGGLGEIQKRQQREAKFREKSSELAQEQLKKLGDQMVNFRANLQEFASKHKKEIRKSPEFRKKFQEMCATVGVDPLQSSSNFWTKLLGVGDFYYELAVQIIEVCMATSHRNGGIMGINELHSRVKASRNSAKNKNEDITIDDLLRAIDKIGILGGGFKIIPSGKTFIIQAVPGELSMDQSVILQKAQVNDGHVEKEMLVRDLKWTEERVVKAINDMIMEEIIWVDKHPGGTWYWVPGLCLN